MLKRNISNLHTFKDNFPIIPALRENGIGILLMNSFALSGFILTCLISTFPKLKINTCIRLTTGYLIVELHPFDSYQTQRDINQNTF